VFLSGALLACDADPGLVESIPLPADAEGVIALSRIDVNGDGTDELSADTKNGMRLVDLAGPSLEVLPVEATLGGHAAASGRFDQSTPDDLALVDRVTGQMSLLRNDGAGGWNGPVDVADSVGNVPIVPSDFDGDGLVDIYAGGSLHRGDGAGGFAQPQPVTGVLTFGPAVRVDADADAADELLTLRDDGTATFWDAEWGAQPLEPDDACPLAATDLAVADVDGDGAEDVVRLVDDGNTSVLTVFLAANDFGFPGHTGLAARHDHLELGDLDGNDVPDAVAWGGPDASTIVYWNLGDPSSCHTTATPIAVDVELGDYDGNGRDDVAVTDGSTLWVLAVE
jgi:hypothetical protein